MASDDDLRRLGSSIRTLRMLSRSVSQLRGTMHGHAHAMREQGQDAIAEDLLRCARELEVTLDGVNTVRRALGIVAYGDVEDTNPGV